MCLATVYDAKSFPQPCLDLSWWQVKKAENQASQTRAECFLKKSTLQHLKCTDTVSLCSFWLVLFCIFCVTRREHVIASTVVFVDVHSWNALPRSSVLEDNVLSNRHISRAPVMRWVSLKTKNWPGETTPLKFGYFLHWPSVRLATVRTALGLVPTVGKVWPVLSPTGCRTGIACVTLKIPEWPVRKITATLDSRTTIPIGSVRTASAPQLRGGVVSCLLRKATLIIWNPTAFVLCGGLYKESVLCTEGTGGAPLKPLFSTKACFAESCRENLCKNEQTELVSERAYQEIWCHSFCGKVLWHDTQQKLDKMAEQQTNGTISQVFKFWCKLNHPSAMFCCASKDVPAWQTCAAEEM